MAVDLFVVWLRPATEIEKGNKVDSFVTLIGLTLRSSVPLYDSQIRVLVVSHWRALKGDNFTNGDDR